jgi:hypothetical protein
MRKEQDSGYQPVGWKSRYCVVICLPAKLFREKYLESTLNYLEELSESLAKEELTYNMSAGVADCIAFQHLRNIDMLDKD